MADDDDKLNNSRDSDDNESGDDDTRFPYMDGFERKLKRKLARKMLKYSYKYQYRHGAGKDAPSVPLPPDLFAKPLSKLTWEEYKKKAVKIADNSKVGMTSHLSSFFAVNAGILVTNLLTSPQYPWFLWVLTSWGIGIVCHFAAHYMLQKRKKEAEKSPELPKEAVPVFHHAWTNASAFFNHFASFTAVNSFLIFVNFFTNSKFLWSLIPLSCWAAGLFIHFNVFRSKNGLFKKRLKEIMEKAGSFFSGSPKKKSAGSAGNDPLMSEAQALKESILTGIDSYGKNSPIDSDIKPVLENYMNQLSDLNIRYREIDNLVRSIPMNDLEADMAVLKKKADTAKSPYMRQEYEKSIKEIEQHKHSYEELSNQKEIIELRLKSSMNHLKQLKIDLARMKGMMIGGDTASVSLLKDRTKELSQYLDDLRQGFMELDQDKEVK